MSLNAIATLCAILTTIAAAIYFIFKEYRKKQLRYRKKLQGYWTNEGDIILSKFETHLVTMGIQTDIEDGEVTGLINSQKIGVESYCLQISINGKLKFRKAKITISDIKQGHVVKFGVARIRIKGKLIEWKLIKGTDSMFPEKSILWKTPFSETKDMM